MTQIVLTRATNLYGIECIGHSGYAETGSDIVCAGISTLTGSFAFLVEEYNSNKRVSLKIFEDSDAYIKILYHDPDGVLIPAYEMVCMGLENIAEQYPDNIKIIF